MGMAASRNLRFSPEILTTSDDIFIDYEEEIIKLEILLEAQKNKAISRLLHKFKPGNITMFYHFSIETDDTIEGMLCGTVVMTNSPATLRAVDLLDLQLLFQFQTFAGLTLDDGVAI
jgi:hypothetical protein